MELGNFLKQQMAATKATPEGGALARIPASVAYPKTGGVSIHLQTTEAGVKDKGTIGWSHFTQDIRIPRDEAARLLGITKAEEIALLPTEVPFSLGVNLYTSVNRIKRGR